jgi:hypothetical protein
MIKMVVEVGVVFAHARDRPGYNRVYEGRHMRGRQGRWAVGRETGGARSRLTRGGVQRREVVDFVVVMLWGGVSDLVVVGEGGGG